jgi:hypothetical protein
LTANNPLLLSFCGTSSQVLCKGYEYPGYPSPHVISLGINNYIMKYLSIVQFIYIFRRSGVLSKATCQLFFFLFWHLKYPVWYLKDYFNVKGSRLMKYNDFTLQYKQYCYLYSIFGISWNQFQSYIKHCLSKGIKIYSNNCDQ